MSFLEEAREGIEDALVSMGGGGVNASCVIITRGLRDGSLGCCSGGDHMRAGQLLSLGVW